MYYLLKDGTRLRRSLVGQVDPRLRDEVDDFFGDSIRALREYGRGRTIMSAIVAVVIGIAAGRRGRGTPAHLPSSEADRVAETVGHGGSP
jgi:hypothetical protein